MIYYRDLCENVENHGKYSKVCPNPLSPKTFHHVLGKGAHLKGITKYNAYLNSIICPVIFLSNYNEYSSYLASDVDWEKNEAQKL